jgi:hypothetical protein
VLNLILVRPPVLAAADCCWWSLGWSPAAGIGSVGVIGGGSAAVSAAMFVAAPAAAAAAAAVTATAAVTAATTAEASCVSSAKDAAWVGSSKQCSTKSSQTDGAGLTTAVYVLAVTVAPVAAAAARFTAVAVGLPCCSPLVMQHSVLQHCCKCPGPAMQLTHKPHGMHYDLTRLHGLLVVPGDGGEQCHSTGQLLCCAGLHCRTMASVWILSKHPQQCGILYVFL